MIKIRLRGTLEEIEGMTKDLSNHYKIINESKRYRDRNSDYYRVYLDAEMKNSKEKEADENDE